MTCVAGLQAAQAVLKDARKGNMADFDGLSFLALDVGLLPPFTPSLPFELLAIIHQNVVSKPLDGTYHKLAILSKTSRGYPSLVAGIEKFGTLPWLNKFYNDLFGDYLAEFVPMHLHLEANFRQLDEIDSFHFEIHDLDRLLPTTSRGLYLRMECKVSALIVELPKIPVFTPLPDHASECAEYKPDQDAEAPGSSDQNHFLQANTESWGTNQWSNATHDTPQENITTDEKTMLEEVLSNQIAYTPPLKDLITLLQASTLTEDVVMEINISSDDFFVHEQDPDTRTHNATFNALVAAAERMTNVKRYSIKVGRFGAFGSRESNMSWKHAGVFRVDHTAAFWQFSEDYLDLLKDLHI